MKKIELKILGISYTHSQSSAYALILAEAHGLRRLPIIIGITEAQSIAIELEKMKAVRPLTHDLFKSFADSFSIHLKEIVINKFEEGIFHSLMTFSDGVEDKHLDARTSDAVAIALRFSAPVFTYEEVLNIAGIILDDDDKGPLSAPENLSDDIEETSGTAIGDDLSKHTLKQLNEVLQQAIENEDFEKASRIRDEIKKRQKKH
jgi:uncharacterized protein